jgi:hypothetical protein
MNGGHHTQHWMRQAMLGGGAADQGGSSAPVGKEPTRVDLPASKKSLGVLASNLPSLLYTPAKPVGDDKKGSQHKRKEHTQ